jgi:hypothetical protein
MTTIVTRAGKGSALTFTEMDNNLTNLNTNKLEAANLTTYTGNITADIINAKTIGNVGTELYGGIQDGNQGAITQVGSLTTLDVTGIVTTGANVDVSGNLSASSASITNQLVTSNFTATGAGLIETATAGSLTVNTTIAADTVNAATIGNALAVFTAENITTVSLTSTDWLDAANIRASSIGNAGATITANSVTANSITVTETLTAANSALQRYQETVVTLGNVSGTFTPNLANGTIQTLTLTGNLTFSQFLNPTSGQSAVFILTQDTTGSRLLTSNMRFAGNSRTLTTTANAVDIMSVAYIGTTYYAALTKGYL